MIWDGIRYETILGKLVLPVIGAVMCVIAIALVLLPGVMPYSGALLAALQNSCVPVRLCMDARHAAPRFAMTS